MLYETKFPVVSPCFVGLDLGRENFGCAVAIEKQGKLDIVHSSNCETENKKIPGRIKERKIARAARRRHHREKRKRRAKQCGTLLNKDLIRQYPGFHDGEITVKGIRNKVRIVHKKTTTRYYLDEITEKMFPIEQSQVLQHNAGWCFYTKNF